MASPFLQEIKDFAAEFRALSVADNERLNRMETYRKELEATRQKPLSGATGADYGRKPAHDEPARHDFDLPFGQAMTVKHSFRVAGRLPDAVVARREETPDERHRSDTMEKLWWGITHASGPTQFSDAAWDASQLGAACFETWMDVKKGMPVYRAIDPAGTIAVKGVLNPHDFERFYRFWDAPLASVVAKYRGRFFGDTPIALTEIQADPTGSVRIVQMTDRHRKVLWALGRENDDRFDYVADVPLSEQTHDYGFVNYVVIPNLGPERNVYGWADYEFVRQIIEYLGSLFGREADILRMVANGAYTMSGTKLSPGAAKRILREGGVLPMSKEGSLTPVGVPDVPNFEESHADRAIKFLEMLGFAPSAAWGDGNAGSGSDRGLQLGPMLELTAMKQINFSSGLSRLGEMLFRIIESKSAEPATFTGTAQRRHKTFAFSMKFGAAADPLQGPDGAQFPMTPKELFGGDYSIGFSWPTRLDPDDPAYVASELNKFVSGVQSARTTLEKFGVESPEDELTLIEQENDDHPWLRQGMLKLIEMQLSNANQQGQNDGSQNVGQNLGAASATMATKDGKALDGDAMSGALPGSFGVLNGQA